MSESKMNEKKKLNEQELVYVNGGTAEEYAELKGFIKAHDPGAVIHNEFDIMDWLVTKTGIRFSYLKVDSGDDYNEFQLKGSYNRIDNDELMAMLRERFPD